MLLACLYDAASIMLLGDLLLSQNMMILFDDVHWLVRCITITHVAEAHTHTTHHTHTSVKLLCETLTFLFQHFLYMGLVWITLLCLDLQDNEFHEWLNIDLVCELGEHTDWWENSWVSYKKRELLSHDMAGRVSVAYDEWALSKQVSMWMRE